MYSPRPWKSCQQTALSCQPHQGLPPLQSAKLCFFLRQPAFNSWCWRQYRFTLLPPTPDNSRVLHASELSVRSAEVSTKISLQTNFSLCACCFLLFLSLPFPKDHLTPRSLSFAFPASNLHLRACFPGNPTCKIDLWLASNRIWQEWWTLLTVIELCKIVTSTLLALMAAMLWAIQWRSTHGKGPREVSGQQLTRHRIQQAAT